MTSISPAFALFLLICCCSAVIAEESTHRKGPLVASADALTWTASDALLKPVDYNNDRCYSVKDPSVVWHDGRWHVFATIRSEKRSHQIEHVCFADWENTANADRHVLTMTPGSFCAPQVFYYSPQDLWYLIYQIEDPSRSPALQPAYSTTREISDPDSWTAPRLMFDAQPRQVKMWIDFWVICDDQKAHLFFTSHGGTLWRSETTLDDFPFRWSSPEIALEGTFFEASHTYCLGRPNAYLTLIEAQDGDHRYYQAYTASRLEGPWSPWAATLNNPFAALSNATFTNDPWSHSISHGELLRSGRDEKLVVDPSNLRFLFQGTLADTRPGKDYGEIPWSLGLLRPAKEKDYHPAKTGLFPYKRWVVDPPILKAGPPGAFDDISVKDPSLVFHDGKWHVFYTTKAEPPTNEENTGTGYVSAPTLAGLATAQRYNINAIVGSMVIAPQIFFFEPHKLWYLIAQQPSPGPSELTPIYLTNPDINDVHGWSKAKILETNRKDDDAFWIDFWIICDDEKAHLFYTDHAGSMFRMETPIGQFPEGFATAREELAVKVHGQDEKGPWRLHEASHIYYVRSANLYLALLEAVRPHPTKRDYWDSRNRFAFAMVADSLEGQWKRVEADENDFIGIPEQVFNKDGTRTRYDQISHPELVRAGINQKLEIEDFGLQLLFQAFDAKETPDSYDYNRLPWEVMMMRNY